MSEEEDEQRFVTPEFQAMYVWLDEKRTPKRIEGDDKEPIPYWCLTCALDADHPFWDELEAKIEIAIENKCGEIPRKYRNPIKDGDEWENEFFHGKRVIELKNTRRKPGMKVFNMDGENYNVTDFDEEIYPGMICVATARMGGYTKGSKGVGAYLHNVLKLEDGERIGPSTASADDDFDGWQRSGGSKKKGARRKKKGARRKAVNPLA